MCPTASFFSLPDPRVFRPAAEAPEPAASWYAMADAALHAATGAVAVAGEKALSDALVAALRECAHRVGEAIAAAPSAEIARHLWRSLDQAVATRSRGGAGDLAATAFALPVVIVAGLQGAAGDAQLSATLTDTPALSEILRAAKALGGSETFGLSAALVSAAALDVAQLPCWLALGNLTQAADRDFLVPAPMRVAAGAESVHLRFLAGVAVAGAGVEVLASDRVGPWGVPFTHELARQLAAPGVSALPLPRPPRRPLLALNEGLLAQREVSAQLFATNAIRKLRASVGEPVAVLSSHRAEGAPGGGELRLSLSSPFDPREAEGFRCPVYPVEPVGAVTAMLLELLRDCRVVDIRQVAGIHPDRVSGSRERLFFKPETIPEGMLLH